MRSAGDAAGDVVVDPCMEHGEPVIEPGRVALEAELDADGTLRIERRVADVEVAVAAGRILEALAHVGGAIGTAEIEVGIERRRDGMARADRPGKRAV